jgi:hypothetical protein
MIQREPFFKSETDMGMLSAIIQKMGSPDVGLYTMLLNDKEGLHFNFKVSMCTFAPAKQVN